MTEADDLITVTVVISDDAQFFYQLLVEVAIVRISFVVSATEIKR